MYLVGELLILINFLMNAFIIWLTAIITNNSLVKSRWLVGALLASLYFIFPFSDNYLSVIFKFIFSLVIIFLVFLPRKAREALTLLLVFYGVSFFLGGGLFGLVFMTGTFQNLAYGQVSWKYLTFSLMLGGAIIWGIRMIDNKVRNRNLKLMVQIRHMNVTCELKGIVDTGNMLRSFVGTPCIIVEKDAVKGLFPTELFNEIKKSEDIARLLDKIDSDHIKAYNFSPVFYNSVGVNQDMLLAFKPDEVIVYDLENNKLERVNSLIALTDQNLNLPAGFSCLLPPGLL